MTIVNVRKLEIEANIVDCIKLEKVRFGDVLR